MKRKLFLEIAARLMNRPAAPYHESLVADEARAICDEHGIPVAEDEFGNVYARHEAAGSAPPLVLAAHMDHPGFEIVRKSGSRRWVARFLGGMPDGYFKSGTGLILLPSGERAVLGRRMKRPKEKRFEIRANGDVSASPEFAVWDLPAFRLRGDRIHARACDDLIGVAVILGTLIELRQRRAKCNVTGFISRAEEVGFQGALAAAAGGHLPKDGLLVSLETSREIPGVKMGEGVIVRVGDRATVFDPAASAYLAELARETAEKDKTFVWQRALMGGGGCEGTAFQNDGFRAAAVCVVLGNVHNCAKGERVRPEFMDVNDALSMARLLSLAARKMRSFDAISSRVARRLEPLRREALRRLRR